MIRVSITVALLLPISVCMAQAGEVLTGRASVIDGDTIQIRGERVRLFGIDAPEGGQHCTDGEGKSYRCGQRAALALDSRIGDGIVTCQVQDTDRYGRKVAVCRAFGEDLGAWMVGLGWALAYRSFSTRYIPAEQLAQQRKAGLWAGSFRSPWEWRSGR